MLKFNDDNIYVGYIKQLLNSFNLPQCQIGDKEFKQTLHYIKGNSLYLYSYDNIQEEGQTRRISNYKRGDAIKNITKNLEIRSNIYDSYTHEYLGDYLRFLRDYDNLDLMSMYNCFSNVVAYNLDFTINGVNFNSSSDEYTIFAIPIKYNKKYTIAIDWHGTIDLCCGFYSNEQRYQSPLNVDASDNTLVERETYLRVSGTRFNHPFVFDKNVISTKYVRDYYNEKNFKLFLRVPTMCKSSIVILEGDYACDTELLVENRRQKLVPSTYFYRRLDEQGEITDDILDSNTGTTDFKYMTKHQLLSINSGESYLLADRLVEYLSNQVITQIDPVINNIKRLQRKALIEYDNKYNTYGIFDEDTRKFLYKDIVVGNDLQNKYYDTLAYVDKDVERVFNIDYIKKDGKQEDNEEWPVHY